MFGERGFIWRVVSARAASNSTVPQLRHVLMRLMPQNSPWQKIANHGLLHRGYKE